jgi:uncharacterized protein (TIGR00369 family)
MRGMGQRDDAAELEWENQESLKNPLHAQMGLRILEHGRHTIVTMELTEAVRGATEGSVHGGMLATLADVASAVALWGAYDPDSELPVTTDLHIRYYRQPRAGPLTARAELVHKGRRILSCECAVEDAQSRVLARSTATYMVVPQR